MLKYNRIFLFSTHLIFSAVFRILITSLPEIFYSGSSKDTTIPCIFFFLYDCLVIVLHLFSYLAVNFFKMEVQTHTKLSYNMSTDVLHFFSKSLIFNMNSRYVFNELHSPVNRSSWKFQSQLFSTGIYNHKHGFLDLFLLLTVMFLVVQKINISYFFLNSYSLTLYI